MPTPDAAQDSKFAQNCQVSNCYETERTADAPARRVLVLEEPATALAASPPLGALPAVRTAVAILSSHVAPGYRVHVDGQHVQAVIQQEVEPGVRFRFLIESTLDAAEATAQVVFNPLAHSSNDPACGVSRGEAMIGAGGFLHFDWAPAKIAPTAFPLEQVVAASRRWPFSFLHFVQTNRWVPFALDDFSHAAHVGELRPENEGEP